MNRSMRGWLAIAFGLGLAMLAGGLVQAGEAPELGAPEQGQTDVSIGSDWTTYSDLTYGFTINMPTGWYTQTASGVLGTVSSLSSYDPAGDEIPEDGIRVDVTVAIRDRDQSVALSEWVDVPSELTAFMAENSARPVVETDDVVIKSYTSGEGTVRRAYLARDSKVYIVDMFPDREDFDGEFTEMVESLAFTFEFLREQPVVSRLFPESPESPFEVFLPSVLYGSAEFRASNADGPASLSVVPASYRLPFVGTYSISQGPYYWSQESQNECVYTHTNWGSRDDSEAIDFAMASGTRLYASESGTVSQHQLGPYGNVVKIAHDDGRVSWYAHLQSFDGGASRVNREALIGRSGNSGTNTSGAHLHFMVDAPNSARSEWIRTMQGISWHSGDPNVPCVYKPEDKAIYGYHDGVATGPPLAPGSTCGPPNLVAPSDGETRTFPVSFRWDGVACAIFGYQFRIRTAADMDTGGTVVQDTVVAGTERTEVFAPFWYGRDLYWSVRALNVPGAHWAPARRFRVVDTPPQTDEMVLIPAGTFRMGCDSANAAEPYGCNWADELPLHTVNLSAYTIDKYEVTNARYKACVDAGACTAPYSSSSYTRPSYYGNPTYANYPVIYVDWFQADAFCAWEGKRLPTEAEWEKAARGPSDTRVYPWGNAAPTCELANWWGKDGGCVGDTAAVGSYPAGASPYGVMDMSGNVWEWVNDWYDGDYYSVSPASNPPGPATGTSRVLRGGSWDDFSWDLRAAFRYRGNPSNWLVNFGFRCVRSQ